MNILQASNLAQLYNNLDQTKNQLSKSTEIISSLKVRIKELEDLILSENENFKSILDQREYEWNNAFKKQDDDWNVQLDKATKEIEDSYSRYSILCDEFKELVLNLFSFLNISSRIIMKHQRSNIRRQMKQFIVYKLHFLNLKSKLRDMNLLLERCNIK